MAVEIANSALDLIGNTPLVRLNRVSAGLECDVVAKLEFFNPGGSSKDRPAVQMIDDAEAAGHLKPGGTIIEPTSGNTGVGLAIVASQRGYDCVFVMTDKVAPEKVDLLRAYGAEVVVCPVAVAPEDPRSYYSVAERLVKERPNAYRPNQYANPSNPKSHYLTTGPELWRQTDGRITHYVAGAGTGGTLCGAGRFLKEQNPNIQIIAADPENSVYSGGSGRPYLVEGVGEDFWPENYDPSVVDRVIAISDTESFHMAHEVSKKEGLLIGGSCGTAVAAGLKVAEECAKDDLVVILIPDSGRGYLSKVFNDTWMMRYGFLSADGPVISDVLAARGSTPPLIYVQPHEPVTKAISLMSEHGISLLPVAEGEMPLNAAEVKGSLSEMRLMQAISEHPAALNGPVSAIMKPHMPTIGVGQSLATAIELLDAEGTSLVLDGGRPIAVVNQSDIVKFLAK